LTNKESQIQTGTLLYNVQWFCLGIHISCSPTVQLTSQELNAIMSV